MELLAPAGTFETFIAALDAGADAVYVGAPDINARSLSRDLKMEEIGAMISICREKGKKLYLAANSLVRQQDLPGLIKTLAVLEALEPDGLIVQDMGLINLVSTHFPALPLHASTLMGAHNRDSVELFASMGCERVVLARELTVDEIDSIAKSTSVELEVFIHGAMCFSYSGFCLFSSFLGGKSGLRGRCVQPCRRRYGWDSRSRGKKGKRGKSFKKTRGQSKGGYLFSMNDLSGLEAVPRLKNIGVASLKIEGRLRTTHYVSNVVKAYRLMIDADKRTAAEALKTSTRLVKEAMGRKVAAGYFNGPQPANAITPFHSGNMGIHLGRLTRIKRIGGKLMAKLTCKFGLARGDRIRCHFEHSGERKSFSVRGLLMNGLNVEEVKSGQTADLELPDNFPHSVSGPIEVFKVDVGAQVISSDNKKWLTTTRKQLATINAEQKKRIEVVSSRALGHYQLGKKKKTTPKQKSGQRKHRSAPKQRQASFEYWLKLDTVEPLLYKSVIKADRFIIAINQKNVAASGRLKRYLGRSIRNVIWSLPPILLEKELGRTRKATSALIRSGFVNFQIGHISQMELFGDDRIHLHGDYTLNLMNHQAVDWAAKGGLESAQLSIELDRGCIQKVVGTAKNNSRINCRLGLTVYGTPPLFTARLAPKHFQYERQLTSPKNEQFVIKKTAGFTQTFPQRPFSLLPYMKELQTIGLDYGVIDLTNMKTSKKELLRLADILSGRANHPKLPTFNYLGKLQ